MVVLHNIVWLCLQLQTNMLVMDWQTNPWDFIWVRLKQQYNYQQQRLLRMGVSPITHSVFGAFFWTKTCSILKGTRAFTIIEHCYWENAHPKWSQQRQQSVNRQGARSWITSFARAVELSSLKMCTLEGTSNTKIGFRWNLSNHKQKNTENLYAATSFRVFARMESLYGRVLCFCLHATWDTWLNLSSINSHDKQGSHSNFWNPLQTSSQWAELQSWHVKPEMKLSEREKSHANEAHVFQHECKQVWQPLVEVENCCRRRSDCQKSIVRSARRPVVQGRLMSIICSQM